MGFGVAVGTLPRLQSVSSHRCLYTKVQTDTAPMPCTKVLVILEDT
jgi:hypothetical protein